MNRMLLIDEPAALSLQNGVMVIDRPGVESERVPVEDVGLVMVESRQVSFTAPLLVHLADNNVSFVCCDASHCPASISLPMKGHSNQGEIVHMQLSADKALKEDLWCEIVRRKILSEISLMREQGVPVQAMTEILSRLGQCGTSGEVAQLENEAAKLYFDSLFGRFFRRNRYGRNPNDFLNYGYSVLRAVVIRELVGAGLFPGEGLYHCNRTNEFPLADDVIEPYRVYVDRIVYVLYCGGMTEFTPELRERLVKVLSVDVKVKGMKHKLSDAVRMTAGSVRDILVVQDDLSVLIYPE